MQEEKGIRELSALADKIRNNPKDTESLGQLESAKNGLIARLPSDDRKALCAFPGLLELMIKAVPYLSLISSELDCIDRAAKANLTEEDNPVNSRLHWLRAELYLKIGLKNHARHSLFKVRSPAVREELFCEAEYLAGLPKEFAQPARFEVLVRDLETKDKRSAPPSYVNLLKACADLQTGVYLDSAQNHFLNINDEATRALPLYGKFLNDLCAARMDPVRAQMTQLLGSPDCKKIISNPSVVKLAELLSGKVFAAQTPAQ